MIKAPKPTWWHTAGDWSLQKSQFPVFLGDVRPSVNIWLSTGVATCRIKFNFTDIIHLVRPIHDTGNGSHSLLNTHILVIPEAIFQGKAFKFGIVGALNRLINKSPWFCNNRKILFLAATKQLYEWYFLSVCLSDQLSVRPSVTPFWLCSHHPVIMKFSGVITKDQGKVHAKGQGQRSKVKVTEVTTQLDRFRTVTPVWIRIWWWNDAYSLM